MAQKPGDYQKHVKDKNVSFFGIPQLTAIFSVNFSDGSSVKITTDESWQCRKGNIVFSHLFDGEVYDARVTDKSWQRCVLTQSPSPDCVMCADILEPVKVKKVFDPVCVHKAGGGYGF